MSDIIPGRTSWKPVEGKRIESIMYLSNSLFIKLAETPSKICINGSIQGHEGGYLEFNVNSLGRIQGDVLVEFILDTVNGSITIVTELDKVEILVHMSAGARMIAIADNDSPMKAALGHESIFSTMEQHISWCYRCRYHEYLHIG